MQNRILLGDPDMLSVQQMVPFDTHVVDFLDTVSDQILHHSLDRSVPGLYSFGFWCRKKHLLQFQRKYRFREARQGKGLIFHICASNIPGLFAWSLAIGLLMGNSNLVRVSSGSDMVSKSYCNIFEKVLEQEKYHDLRNRMAVITYPRENEALTIKYSEQCDVRIIWGGDRAIGAIQKLQCKRKPEDIVFPDRTSVALLDAEKINRMSEDALMIQARLFYDDTYSMDQNACSSPQLVLWYGTEAVCEKAAVRWWRAVNGLLDDYSVSEKQIYDKYSLACETAMQMDCRKITWVNQKLCHIELNTIKSDWDRFRGNSGIFLEYRIDSYQQIREADSGKLQTLLVFGVDISELQKVIISLNMKGISRVVNMGQAMEMDLVWDGTDLTQCLTEEKNDFFQWQKAYCNRKMLIDDQGRSVTYREAEQFGEEYFGDLRQETLIAILVQNTIGSVLIYMNALRHHLIPLLLDSKTDLNRFVEIVEKYKPEYIALPEGKDEYLACLNRTYTDERYSEKWHAENYYFFSDEFSDVWTSDIQLLGKKEKKTEEKIHPNLALLLSTSGSTGSPKFVKISRQNLQMNTSVIAEYLNISADDRPITTLPMNYTYGLSIINSHIYKGAAVLLTDRSVMEKEFWDFFAAQKATTFGGVPYTFKMLKYLGFLKMQLPSLRVITQAGGKLPIELQETFTKYAAENNRQFIVMYGQTEATARMAYLPWEYAETKRGSIGIAIPKGNFQLEGEDGQVVSEARKKGELIYYGPNVTMGYAYDRVSLSVGDENHGRLETGDIACRDEDGFYYITGRKKRFLKLLGKRVSLDETENLLAQAFAGAEFACVGTDDKMQVFYSGNGVNPQEVVGFLSNQLSLFRKNFQIHQIAEIPRNASGKVLYSELNLKVFSEAEKS